MQIDVILKTFKGRRWIHEAIDSVLAQTYASWRLTVVDDACPEATGRYVEDRYQRERDRISIVRLHRNLGPLGAQIEGIKATSGDAVAFIDQDDRWHAEKLAMQVERLGQDPAVDGVHTDVRHVDPAGKEIEGSADRENAIRAEIDYQALDPADLARSLFSSYSLRVVTTLSSREALVRSGNLGVAPLTDTAFWVRFAASGHRLAHIPRPLVDRRIHPGQFSRSQRAGRLEAHLRATDELATAFPELLGDLVPGRKERLLTEKLGVSLSEGDGRRAREAIRDLRGLGRTGMPLAAGWLLSWTGPLQRPAARAYRRMRSSI